MRTIRGLIYTLRPYERGIQETLGKYTQTLVANRNCLHASVVSNLKRKNGLTNLPLYFYIKQKVTQHD